MTCGYINTTTNQAAKLKGTLNMLVTPTCNDGATNNRSRKDENILDMIMSIFIMNVEQAVTPHPTQEFEFHSSICLKTASLHHLKHPPPNTPSQYNSQSVLFSCSLPPA